MEDLPTLTPAPRLLTGTIRSAAADFRVDEVPAYSPCGEGEHLYVRFEKIDLDTREAVRRIARALGVHERDSGVAGMKDRRAITTQWASFGRGEAERLNDSEIDGVRVLEVSRHTNKLRTGHLRANRFDILVRGGAHDTIDDVRARLDELARRGVPNYYGEQRFGRDNLGAARRWLLEGGRAPRDRFERKLLVSTLQSSLFNELLAERVRERSIDSVIDGDLLRKEETGGMFVTEGPGDVERAARFEVSATGPMFGAKMRWPEGEAKRREEATLERAGVSMATLEQFEKSGAGTRRPYRVQIEGAEVLADPDGVRLRFTLPSGAYATVVLREVANLP
jgi:tRNA pseudouridine13 synthase